MLFATFSHAADKTVLIGLAAPMSGLSGSTGVSLQRAAEIAIRDLNVQNLRIGGDRIVFKLLPQDDRADPRAGELIADYFVKSKVAAVVGHWNSGVGIPASKIYNAAGIPQVAPAVTSHAYTQQGFATTFRIVGHDDDGARYTAEYVMRDLKARRIVIIDDRTPFGAGYAEQFDKAIGELKGNVAGHFSIGSKTSDFNEVLRQTKALDPDVIMFGGLDAQAGELVREIKRLEVPGRLVGIGGVVGQTFLKLAGTAGEGTTVLEPGLPSYKNAQWTHFQKSWKQQYSDPIYLYAPSAYDAVQVIAAAMRQANAVDPVSVTQALHKVRHKGITGEIAFDEDGNLRNPQFTLYQVRKQEWLVVKTITGKN